MPAPPALIALLLASSAALLPLSHASIVLSSSQASYVIDLEHGCSVSGAWAEGDPSKTNLINTADLGRYVQVLPHMTLISLIFCTSRRIEQASYYAGPSPYDNCFWRSQPWPWSEHLNISIHDCDCFVHHARHRPDLRRRFQGQSCSRSEQ
jgi:hypothetical protein